ncbi:MAG TPA: hypothetical protein VES39_10570, partial [Rhodospirillales bacterium]|nr:hypothetical protein [Rhodospirillales bacterium]
MTDEDAARDDIAWMESDFPDALRLAEAASLAARVEPELLRALRLLFPAMGADAEADLWFSPLVQQQNAVMMVLVPAAAHLLQQRLKADEWLLDEAWKTIFEMHEPLPPALRAQEELAWLALQGEAERPRAEDKLAEILTALVRDGRSGLASWGSQALPRLPPTLHAYDHFSTLAWAVQLRTPVPGLGSRTGMTLSPSDGLGWLLPKDFPEVRLGVDLRDGVLHLSQPAADATYAITVPATEPAAVEVIERVGDADHRRWIQTIQRSGLISTSVAEAR